MKKILLLCCFLLGVTAISYAQGMRMSPEDRAKMMQDSLKLTDAQTSQVLAIYKTAAAQRDSLRNAGGDMSGMRTIMMSANQKIEAILTDDQKVAYKKMMDNMRARFQNRGGGGGN